MLRVNITDSYFHHDFVGVNEFIDFNIGPNQNLSIQNSPINPNQPRPTTNTSEKELQKKIKKSRQLLNEHSIISESESSSGFSQLKTDIYNPLEIPVIVIWASFTDVLYYGKLE